MKDIMTEEFRVLDIEETTIGWIGKYFKRVDDHYEFRGNLVVDEPTEESFADKFDELEFRDALRDAMCIPNDDEEGI